MTLTAGCLDAERVAVGLDTLLVAALAGEDPVALGVANLDIAVGAREVLAAVVARRAGDGGGDEERDGGDGKLHLDSWG